MLFRSYAVEIKRLEDHIEYLQMTPAKRKKYDEMKSKQTSEEIPADGGTF